MGQLEFEEELAAQMEVVYRQPDILRRRALVHEALGASPGERVLDAGCGPGFYVAEVLEYVADVPAALGELLRVLRPGGRVLIWDVDWATVSWHSEDPARMERFLGAWDEHLADPSLPRTLSARLREAGFEQVEMQGHAFVSDDVTEESYAGALVPLMADYVGTDEAGAWADEQRKLQARGESYFACIQLCFTGTRPA